MNTSSVISFADRASNEDPLRHLFSTPTEFISSLGAPCRYLCRSGGSKVYLHDDDYVVKHGSRIGRHEAAAMYLVQEKTDVPIGYLFKTVFEDAPKNGKDPTGTLYMDFVPGTPLDKVWKQLTQKNKGDLCGEIWQVVNKIRQIQQPDDIKQTGLYACLTDGSPSPNPLLGSWDKAEMKALPPMRTHEDVRNRIYQRYLDHNGMKYNNGVLLDMLPKYSTGSVFTHGDIAPRNIMVETSENEPDTYKFMALLD